MAYFTLFRSSLFTKNTSVPTVFMILECGLQYYTNNKIVYEMSEMKLLIFAAELFRRPESQNL